MFRIYIAIIFFIVITVIDKVTSTTYFCLSCHEMILYETKRLESRHAHGRDGKDIGCVKCHLPANGLAARFVSKTFQGARSLLSHFSRKKIEVKSLKERAAEWISDSSCRACHADLMLNASGNAAVSEDGRKDHAQYLKNNPHPDRVGCARCHAGIKRYAGKKKGTTEVKTCVSCHEETAHKL